MKKTYDKKVNQHYDKVANKQKNQNSLQWEMDT